MTVEEIAARLVAQARRVSVAEADTCGLVGYLLSTVPGSSQFFPASLPIRGDSSRVFWGCQTSYTRPRGVSVLKWRLPWLGAYAI